MKKNPRSRPFYSTHYLPTLPTLQLEHPTEERPREVCYAVFCPTPHPLIFVIFKRVVFSPKRLMLAQTNNVTE